MNKNNAWLGGLAIVAVLILFVFAISVKTDTQNNQSGSSIKNDGSIAREMLGILPVSPGKETGVDNDPANENSAALSTPLINTGFDQGVAPALSQNSNVLKILPETLKKIDTTTFEVDLFYQNIENRPLIGQTNEIIVEVFSGVDWSNFYYVSEIGNGYYRTRLTNLGEGLFRVQGVVPEVISQSPLISKIAVSSNTIKILNTKNGFLIVFDRTKTVFYLHNLSKLENLLSVFLEKAVAAPETKIVPIKIWTDDNVNINDYWLNERLEIANKSYENSGIQFKYAGIGSMPKGLTNTYDVNRNGMIDTDTYKKDGDQWTRTQDKSEILQLFNDAPKEDGYINLYLIEKPLREANGVAMNSGNQLIIEKQGGDIVLGHELGHNLGLEHTDNDIGNLLYPYDHPGENQTHLTPEQSQKVQKTLDQKVEKGEIKLVKKEELKKETIKPPEPEKPKMPEKKADATPQQRSTPLGEDCGGRTEPKEGLGPVFGTLTCRICNLACFPKAYLWDSVTKTCGCAG